MFTGRGFGTASVAKQSNAFGNHNTLDMNYKKASSINAHIKIQWFKCI